MRCAERGRACHWLMLGLLAWASACAGQDQPPLRGRLQASPGWHSRLALSAGDRQWLQARGALRIGVGQLDYPPFDMSGDGPAYEGINADMAGLLGQLLGVPVQVHRFIDRDAAFTALREGEVDLVGGAGAFDAALHHAALSVPYATEHPSLARRIDTPTLAADCGPRAAVVAGYMPMARVVSLCPHAVVTTYPSLLAALAAVSFGQADVVLGNAVALRRQLDRSQLNNLGLAPLRSESPAGLGFAINPKQARLRGLVDRAIEAMGSELPNHLLRTWAVNPLMPMPEGRLNLSEADRAWAASQPTITVAVNGRFVPVAHLNDQGMLSGIAGDVLSRISQLTGLRFEALPVANLPELIEAVDSGRARMASSVPATAERRRHLLFSRAWLASSMVLVSRRQADAPATLNDMAGRTLAIPQGSPGWQAAQALAPSVRRLPALGTEQALAQVARGRADAALVSLVSARALIARDAPGELHISAALPLPPLRFRFAMGPEDGQLQRIIDQALDYLAPTELEDISRRWRGRVAVGESSWPRYGLAIVAGLVAAVLLCLLALAWAGYLRRQVQWRKAAEAALTDQLEFMRVLIDGTPHPLYVRDRRGRLLNCNASYLETLGVSRESLLGRRATDSLPLALAQREAFEQVYRQAVATGEPVIADYRVNLDDGRVLTLYHWTLPYRGSDGAVAGLICGWVDVTERQCLYEAVRRARDDADAANRAKTRFLATASHEIRTPMNAVLGMLELARRHAEQGQVNELALDVASEAATGLLALLDDVLDISRIEAGQLSLHPQPVALNEVIEACVRLFNGQARHRGVRLRMAQRGGPWAVQADPLRLRQLLGNLLSNAIKFTPKGQVRVRLLAVPGEGHLHVRLVVIDNGIGIPASDLASLGQPWSQATNHQQGNLSGSGLGLNICHHLARLMGGALKLSSRLGEGTRVQLSLQLPCTELPGGQPIPAAGEPPRQVPLRILVVEDYTPSRLLLDQQLRHLGHQVTLTNDGRAGLRAWLAEPFDRVICDCHMPGMDGYQLARAIRLAERRQGRTPVRLLGYTAEPGSAQRGRCLRAGMDDCLIKPLGLRALAEALQGEAAQGGADNPLPYDPQVLDSLAGAEPTTLANLAQTLIDVLRQDHALLAREGVDREVLHRVLGGARIVRARAVIELCEAVRREADQLPALLAAMEQLVAALEARKRAVHVGG